MTRNNRKRYHMRDQLQLKPTVSVLTMPTEPVHAGNLTIQDILDQSPADGGQLAFYSANCCWWTSFPEDLGALPPVKYNSKTGHIEPDPGGHSLPCCPHCGSVLLQAPLKPFIEEAQKNPEHYGPGGMATFVATHHRNSKTCHQKWNDYQVS